MEAALLYYGAMQMQLRMPSEKFAQNHPSHYKAWQQIVAHRMKQAVTDGR